MDNATQELTGLADTVRNVSGVSGKLSVNDMKATVGQLSAFKDYGTQDRSVDCNALTNPGCYVLHFNALNAPVDSWGLLTTLKFADNFEQIFTSVDNPTVYFRLSTNSKAWTSWCKLGGVLNPVLSIFRGILPSREMEVAA